VWACLTLLLKTRPQELMDYFRGIDTEQVKEMAQLFVKHGKEFVSLCKKSAQAAWEALVKVGFTWLS
jgi:hypothetical protein